MAKEGVVVWGIPLQFTGLYFTQHPPLLNSPHNTPVIEEGNKYKNKTKQTATWNINASQEGWKEEKPFFSYKVILRKIFKN